MNESLESDELDNAEIMIIGYEMMCGSKYCVVVTFASFAIVNYQEASFTGAMIASGKINTQLLAATVVL